MRLNLFLLSAALIIFYLKCIGQNNQRCFIEIVRLEPNKVIWQNKPILTDSILNLPTTQKEILVHNREIKTIEISSDSMNCNAEGALVIKSLQYTLTPAAIMRLTALDIPLCCGIPVAVKLNNVELYRAVLWNPVSSFSNKCVTMFLIQDKLIVTNQLPEVPDGKILIHTKASFEVTCLLSR
jgi:hypothetical protein